MSAKSIALTSSGHTAYIALCYTHKAVWDRLAVTEVGTVFYRHTYRIGITCAGEQWVTNIAIISEENIHSTKHI